MRLGRKRQWSIPEPKYYTHCERCGDEIPQGQENDVRYLRMGFSTVCSKCLGELMMQRLREGKSV